ncbi:hypothetical protein E6C60_4157 [Paenibacillus algicola]|uniref:Uncharacterized protein n=1 Tax=Paenibacillus algicola TaxID=2565926 RepID=A0A4P8XPS6_9BACL|nr:hypothetical protein E6C60_4157 [Paenibacillus algicola]
MRLTRCIDQMMEDSRTALVQEKPLPLSLQREGQRLKNASAMT